MAQMSEKYKISYHTLKKRLNLGWDVKKAIETPVERGKRNGM